MSTHTLAYVVVTPEVIWFHHRRRGYLTPKEYIRGIIEDELSAFCYGSDHDCEKTEENDYQEDCWHCDHAYADIFTVGGHYSGRLVGFDPKSNPLNQRPCPGCKGGRASPTVGHCTKCDGNGFVPFAELWKYAPYNGDILTVEEFQSIWFDLPEDLHFPAACHVLNQYGMSDPRTPQVEGIDIDSPVWSDLVALTLLSHDSKALIAICDCEN